MSRARAAVRRLKTPQSRKSKKREHSHTSVAKVPIRPKSIYEGWALWTTSYRRYKIHLKSTL
jgi:hypothetical protein